ncbi:MAG TPA: hypothetical protein VJ810_39185 [Blastocatellia bacterium]|nr:hypothetical protein [Blastocatellia bacterium]
MEKLQRDVRLLKVYAIGATLLLGSLLFAGFGQANQKTKFTEIDVERINIVEKDGKLKMVISNSERQHPGVIDGKTLSRTRPAGMLFFNEKGDECGGLSFSGDQKDGKASASALLAFDKFQQDQTVGIQYGESNGQYYAGLRVWDRPDASLGDVIDQLQAIQKMPDGPQKTQAMQKLRNSPAASGPQRVFVGKTREKEAALTLSDTQGRPRLQLMVDAQGAARIEFLDEKGNVVQRLPAEGGGERKP